MSEACVDKLKVLADRTRLAALRVLLDGPRHVNDLVAALGVEQSLLSHHLRVLRDAGLVESERDGKGVLYRVADEVAAAPAGQALDLGCCRLSFDAPARGASDES